MSMRSILAVLGAAALATAIQMATPASASVIYDFSGNFLGSNSAPPDATFEITSPTVITSTETFSSTASSLSCTGVFVTCTGVTFTPNSGSQDVIQINYNDFGTLESVFYYFQDGAFNTDGTYSQDAGIFYDNATLTVSGITAAPEPATWAMMLLGSGFLGLVAYRRSRKRPVAFTAV